MSWAEYSHHQLSPVHHLLKLLYLYLALSIDPDGLLHKQLKSLFSAAALVFLKMDKMILF